MRVRTPYTLNFVQIDRTQSDSEFTLVYVFFADCSLYGCLVKYIVRLEYYDGCFALKYYCARSKHSPKKYSRVINIFKSYETKRIMETCAATIPLTLKNYPGASFAFNGSRTYDRKNYIESPNKTQRYRIYCELVRRLFGEKLFHISTYDESSSCIFVNRHSYNDVEDAADKIYNKFAMIYDI